jgi:hypothetical protein
VVYEGGETLGGSKYSGSGADHHGDYLVGGTAEALS